MKEITDQIIKMIKKASEESYDATMAYIAYRNGVAAIWTTLSMEQKEKFVNAHNEVLEILRDDGK